MSDDETSHLSNLSDGAGCTEIWEHLSEQRAAVDEDEHENTDEDDETVDTETSTEDEPEDEPENEAAGVPCP